MLEDYRPYLNLLARLHLGRRLQSKLDAADVVQETLTAACASLGEFRGETDAELAAWLGRTLARRLANLLRHWDRGRRDAKLECSLQAALDESSARVEAWLADDQSSVGERLARKERAVRLARALEQLPPLQREALVLRHLEGRPLAEIARRLGRSAVAIAGLLHRGLKTLRTLLEGPE
jgi:RNA polymerase sigma-70 factor (ECF subfamily)